MSARQQVEAAADRIRDELLTTLKELDRRRLSATDLRYQLATHRRAVLLAAAGVFGIGTLSGTVLLFRAARRRRARFGARVKAVRRAWKHPERLASRSANRPALSALARRLAFALGSALGSRLITYWVGVAVRPRAPADQNRYFH